MSSARSAGASDVVRIFIDADACPVKSEVYKVAGRHAVPVFVVANRFMAVPRDEFIQRVVVQAGADAADDWIAERAGCRDIVITADIPLAHRCLKRGARALAPTGRVFDEASIGMALATRNLLDQLRSAGAVTSGPKALGPADRSRFLAALDLAITRLKRSADRQTGARL